LAESVETRPRRDGGEFQPLDGELISNLLAPATRMQLAGLTILDTVDSTNSALQRLPAGQQHARAVLAESQSSGRGRRNRTWFSPPGCNIYLSFGWRFANDRGGLSHLPLVAAICACRALARAGLRDHGIKWPNDVLVGQSKLAGILVEMNAIAGGPATAVIGLGLNVNMPPGSRAGREAGATIDREWTDLSSSLESPEPPCRNTLAALLLDELVGGARTYGENGFAAFRKDWQALDLLSGRSVELQHRDRVLTGIARGIDEAGGLRVETGGRVTIFHAGEVRVYHD
jgi:BirA family biotin operon repressor/biotin-[acetyl-CoA-carboxylase] ligase